MPDLFPQEIKDDVKEAIHKPSGISTLSMNYPFAPCHRPQETVSVTSPRDLCPDLPRIKAAVIIGTTHP